MPGFPSFLRWLVENWNYHIALEDYPPDSASQSATADLGGSLRSRTGLADDLIAQFNAWRARTLESEGPTYFVRWDGKRDGAVSSFGCTSRFGMQREDGSEGTHGIKRSYLQVCSESAPLPFLSRTFGPLRPPLSPLAASPAVHSSCGIRSDERRTVQSVHPSLASFAGNSYWWHPHRPRCPGHVPNDRACRGRAWQQDWHTLNHHGQLAKRYQAR